MTGVAWSHLPVATDTELTQDSGIATESQSHERHFRKICSPFRRTLCHLERGSSERSSLFGYGSGGAFAQQEAVVAAGVMYPNEVPPSAGLTAPRPLDSYAWSREINQPMAGREVLSSGNAVGHVNRDTYTRTTFAPYAN